MYDISMVSRDQVLGLINEKAGLSLTFDQVSFGEPVTASGDSPERNTELKISGIPNKGFKGETQIFYDRIDLSEFLSLPQVAIIQVEGAPTIEKILTYFNSLYGSNLQLDDVRDDHVMPTVEELEGGTTFILRAAALSYAYRNNVELTIQPADIDIDVAITDKMLDGLEFRSPSIDGEMAS